MGTPRGNQVSGMRTPVGGANRGNARGDPRNQQGGRNQQGRGNQNLPPVEPLKRTQNAYDVTKAKPQTHTDAVLKEARGILNKLTLTNFDKLSIDIAKLDIRGPEDLKGLVTIIFDTSLEVHPAPPTHPTGLDPHPHAPNAPHARPHPFPPPS
jgi:hypothetical protein